MYISGFGEGDSDNEKDDEGWILAAFDELTEEYDEDGNIQKEKDKIQEILYLGDEYQTVKATYEKLKKLCLSLGNKYKEKGNEKNAIVCLEILVKIIENYGSKFKDDDDTTLIQTTINSLKEIETLNSSKDLETFKREIQILNTLAENLRETQSKSVSIKLFFDKPEILQKFEGIQCLISEDNKLTKNEDIKNYFISKKEYIKDFLYNLKAYQYENDKILKDLSQVKITSKDLTELEYDTLKQFMDNSYSVVVLCKNGITFTDLKKLDPNKLCLFMSKPHTVTSLMKMSQMKITFTDLKELKSDMLELFLNNASEVESLGKIRITFKDLKELELDMLILFLNNAKSVRWLITKTTFKELIELEYDTLKHFLNNASAIAAFLGNTKDISFADLKILEPSILMKICESPIHYAKEMNNGTKSFEEIITILEKPPSPTLFASSATEEPHPIDPSLK